MTKTFNVSIENPCSVPSIHVGCFTTTNNFNSKGSDALFWPLLWQYLYAHTYTKTYIPPDNQNWSQTFLNAHIYLPESTLYYTQGSALVWECFSSFLLEKRMARENSGSACKFYFYNDSNPNSPYHKAEFPRHCGLS